MGTANGIWAPDISDFGKYFSPFKAIFARNAKYSNPGLSDKNNNEISRPAMPNMKKYEPRESKPAHKTAAVANFASPPPIRSK